jgi:hypothetical protein
LRWRTERCLLTGVSLIVVALSFACARAERRVIRTIKDGVETVENGAGIYAIKGEPRALTLREEFRIDLEDERLGAAGLTDLAGLDVDSRGDIFVFRRWATDGNIIFKFDSRGVFVRSFCPIGGQGPGEVENPRFMRLTLKDEIPIVSLGQLRVLYFDTEGRLVRQSIVPASFRPIPSLSIPLANGDILAAYFHEDPQTLKIGFGVGVFTPDLTKRRDLRTYPVPDSDDLRTIFVDTPVMAASDTAIFVTSMAFRRDIEVFDLDGRLVRRILADYPGVDVPSGFRGELLGSLRPDHPFWKNLAFPKSFPPFLSLFTDDRGRLYAAGYGKDPGTGASICDVFSRAGVRILRTALGHLKLQLNNLPIPPVIKNNRLYCIREKPGDYPEVLVYSLHWTLN